MMLIEETSLPDAALPVDALKRHMRMGTGFAEDGSQDELLASFLRAAMAAIEARTGKVLLQRSFQLLLTEWASVDRQPLPVAPVLAVGQVSLCRPILPDTDLEQLNIISEQGTSQILDPMRYRLELDTHVPCLRMRSGCFPTIPNDGMAVIRFSGGLAPTFQDLPADMAQAVLMLAGHYDEYRNDVGLSQGCMPFGVTSLIARYCPMRIGFSS
ncbi:head-tail connector protein [Puniceibacterium sediminis]|uniref:Phage gp6-like head-tail connector protein n=1 Tax=Puniceibacterium sediminis TaxID=1608407 RepID=A0A238XRF3_9RHOB|nr:hypothetical protein [Puniceibacterium sediminis]SNR60914.1 phage conserved hypothetical protein, phiE125 gp8 family [Puniceibacterium sediminis]